MIPGPNVYPKNWWSILALAALSLALVASDIAFWVWRQDKPHGSPGGPLAGMGGWVLFWEWTFYASPMLVIPSLYRIGRGIQERIRAVDTGNTGPA